MTSRLDALVLLSDILKKDKSYVLAHPDEDISQTNLTVLNKQINRRLKHEPLAYIRGFSEFYGRNFLVNKHTLIPRPETETMLDLFTKIYNSQKSPLQKVRPFTERENVILNVIDVGTGSGVIGIDVKLEHPELTVFATDISTECLKIAKQNSELHNTHITYLRGDLLEPILSVGLAPQSAILANLPYVPSNYTINQDAEREPKLAIFGGEDGLDLYRKLFDQIYKANSSNILSKNHPKPQYVFTESMPAQHQILKQIADSAGYELADSEDFILAFRSILP